MSEEGKKDGNQSEKEGKGQFPTLSRVDSVEAIGTQIGPYELLSVLGEGGFGIVYRAEQKEPVRRQVALKLIKPGMDSKQVIARFESERQALALLDHPNIAHIFDGGTTQSGRPYFVMEYVKGMPITEYCDRNKLDTEERLQLFIQVCEAIQHAHQKGIIHRDVKPSNILVSKQEDKADLKVIDFGVAKAISQPLTERTLFTEQGQLIGTPEYMSPEQAELTNQDIDTRSDIYSLGVLLYELLTGTLPFEPDTLRAAAFDEVIRIIRDTDPPRPSTRLLSLGEKATTAATNRRTDVRALSKRLHKELEWIPLKAMRKEPDRRYKTASEFADDVRNYLNGDPLTAGPESRTYRLKKTIKRHQVVVSATAVVLMTLAAGIVATTMFALKAIDERDKKGIALERAIRAEKNAQGQAALAEEQRKMAVQAQNEAQEQQKLAEENAEKTRRSLYINRINLAEKYYGENNIKRVHELLKVCPKDLRGWEWYHLWRVSNQARVTLRGHEDLVTQVAFSPDGRRILSCDYDGTLKAWDAKSGTELMTLKRDDWLFSSVAFSRDCMRIFSVSRDKNLKIWDVNSGTEVMTLGQVEDWLPDSLTFSRDGRMIAAHIHGILKVWDAKSGSEVMSMKVPMGPSPVALSPDGRWIVSGGLFNTLKVLDAKSGDERMTLKFNILEGSISSVAFEPYGRWIASGSGLGTLRTYPNNPEQRNAMMAQTK
jgi:serine/threonine protein kinase